MNEGTFTGMKVFSASMMAERALLGDKLTDWLGAHRDLEVTEIVVTQSSDSAYHCLSFCVFYRARGAASAKLPS